MSADRGPGTVRIWDLPTRLFKWTLVVLVVFQVLSVKWSSGPSRLIHQWFGVDWLQQHFWCGYAILTLLLFRLLWGLVGSTTARFSDFAKGPIAGLHHLREMLGSGPPREVGHNAVGGWMVVALILGLLVQASSGLFMKDHLGMGNDGPLVAAAGDAWAEKMTSLHHLWINLLYILVALHVLAAVLYLVVKKQDLIVPMITGRKKRDDVVAPGAPLPALRFQNSGVALGCLLVSGGIVFGVLRIFG